jgi:molybdopterin converting factor small subunit
VLDAEGALRPLVNVYVDGDDAKEQDGLATALEPGTEVRVVAAIAGG